MSFKVGDFCFCDFNLSEIKAIKNGCIQEISDAYFNHSAPDLNDRCFPISLRIKAISEYFSTTSDKLYKLQNNALNYPDFQDYLIKNWVKACKTSDANKLKIIYNQIEEWFREIEQELDNINKLEVGGVRLFR